MKLQNIVTLFSASALAIDLRLYGRQAQVTPSGFSSAASQLVSLYVQNYPSAYSAIVGAASSAGVTGDAASILQSAFTATSPPAWLTAVPTAYVSNIVSLESVISDLRGAAATGITGAPYVTQTVIDGTTVATTLPSAPPSGSNPFTSLEASISRVKASASSTATMTSAVHSSLTASLSSAVSSNSVTVSGALSTAARSSTSSSSSGFAAPTKAPIPHVALIGLMGIVLAL